MELYTNFTSLADVAAFLTDDWDAYVTVVEITLLLLIHLIFDRHTIPHVFPDHLRRMHWLVIRPRLRLHDRIRSPVIIPGRLRL